MNVSQTMSPTKSGKLRLETEKTTPRFVASIKKQKQRRQIPNMKVARRPTAAILTRCRFKTAISKQNITHQR